jgi:hypothetical protein
MKALFRKEGRIPLEASIQEVKYLHKLEGGRKRYRWRKGLSVSSHFPFAPPISPFPIDKEAGGEEEVKETIEEILARLVSPNSPRLNGDTPRSEEDPLSSVALSTSHANHASCDTREEGDKEESDPHFPPREMSPDLNEEKWKELGEGETLEDILKALTDSEEKRSLSTFKERRDGGALTGGKI